MKLFVAVRLQDAGKQGLLAVRTGHVLDHCFFFGQLAGEEERVLPVEGWFVGSTRSGGRGRSGDGVGRGGGGGSGGGEGAAGREAAQERAEEHGGGCVCVRWMLMCSVICVMWV